MTHKTKKILIDCRMLYASGVGVNLRSVLTNLESDAMFILAGNPDEISTLSLNINYTVKEFKHPIFSMKEQWFYFRHFNKVDCIWFPHWNIPLFTFNRIPKIVTICDTYHLDRKHEISLLNYLVARLFLKRAVSQADKVVTISEFSKNKISENLKFNDVTVSKCGVPEIKKYYSEYQRKKLNLPENYFLFIGNNKPHKNLLKLVDVIDKIPDMHLVIAGRMGGFRTQGNVFKVGSKEGSTLLNKVHIIDQFSDEEKYCLIKNSRGLVMPSTYEGFGLPPLEAQDCGVVALVSDIPVMREIYGDSVLYFDPHSDADIRRALVSAISDTDLVERKCLEGTLNVNNYSWEVAAQKYKEMFEEVI
jgi:glycosyltransferase involved in cell wall biosynthesis